ncbi:hypothetical protein, partial [Xanthomonas fragariae]|uniref:hypothetical protein n=1 Tax=Xanthomonas fragariae TaxID=48664 RepID=UPI001F2A96C6
AQEANDLLFGKALLHVQSPRGRELDSKLRRYSKLGGRRGIENRPRTTPQRTGWFADAGNPLQSHHDTGVIDGVPLPKL